MIFSLEDQKIKTCSKNAEERRQEQKNKTKQNKTHRTLSIKTTKPTTSKSYQNKKQITTFHKHAMTRYCIDKETKQPSRALAHERKQNNQLGGSTSGVVYQNRKVLAKTSNT